MITDKKLTSGMRRRVWRKFPTPGSACDPIDTETWDLAYVLVDHGYILGSSKVSELSEDLVALGVWEGMIDWEGTADG